MSMDDSGIPAGEEPVCPGCGRYIGPVRTCPYCDAEIAVPGPVRALRAAALGLACTGLLFLYLMARYGEAPWVEIESVSPLMNDATVRLSGIVDSNPYIVRRNGSIAYLSFLLNDGTGSARVSAESETAVAMEAADLIPEHGQRVSATGRITARAGTQPRLRVQTVSGMTLFLTRAAEK